jgi:hypothetical protein
VQLLELWALYLLDDEFDAVEAFDYIVLGVRAVELGFLLPFFLADGNMSLRVIVVDSIAKLAEFILQNLVPLEEDLLLFVFAKLELEEFVEAFMDILVFVLKLGDSVLSFDLLHY